MFVVEQFIHTNPQAMGGSIYCQGSDFGFSYFHTALHTFSETQEGEARARNSRLHAELRIDLRW
jgi:hypothetical protein